MFKTFLGYCYSILFILLPFRSYATVHIIHDTHGDIRDLDVGDITDFNVDLPPRVIKEIRALKENRDLLESTKVSLSDRERIEKRKKRKTTSKNKLKNNELKESEPEAEGSQESSFSTSSKKNDKLSQKKKTKQKKFGRNQKNQSKYDRKTSRKRKQKAGKNKAQQVSSDPDSDSQSDDHDQDANSKLSKVRHRDNGLNEAYEDEPDAESDSDDEQQKKFDRMDPSQILNSGTQVGAVTMSFIIINFDYVEKHNGKEGMNELAKRWQGMLLSAGHNDIKFYAVDPDKLLVVTNSQKDQDTLKDFIFGFKEQLDYMEIQNQRVFPDGRSKPNFDDEYRRQRMLQLGWESTHSAPIDHSGPKITKPMDKRDKRLSESGPGNAKKSSASSKKKKSKRSQKKSEPDRYVYHVRQREILPKDKYQQEVLGKSAKINEDRWKSCAGKMMGERYEEQPTLTPKQDAELKKKQAEPLMKFKWQDRFQDPMFIVPGNNKTSYKPQWRYLEPKDLIPQVDLSKTKVRPQWFPKNMLDVNLPRVKLYGIDPIYYDNPPHMDIRNEYGSHPAPPKETPTTAQKWHTQEAWNDPLKRSVFKITEKVIPPAQKTNNLPPL